jgi:hypothetical protein
MTGITGTAADMEGTIGAGMTTITDTGVTPDRTGATGSGIEIDRQRVTDTLRGAIDDER